MLSLYDGSLHTYANTCTNVGPQPLFSLEKLFAVDQMDSLGISHHRPVKDSDQHLCHQAELPCRHTSERIQGTMSTPVRAYLVI